MFIILFTHVTKYLWERNVQISFYFFSYKKGNSRLQNVLRRPGIEPGEISWKAAMLTTAPPAHVCLEIEQKHA